MTWCSKGSLDVLHLHIAPEFLVEVANLAGAPQPERVELVSCFQFRDPLVQQLAQALVRELETGGLGGDLFADSLTRTLGVHLLRHHSTVKLAAPPRGGLPAQKLRRVIEYIHEHLAQELSLTDLATAAEVNPHHFKRLFKQSTGLAPHQYVIQCRVECAQQLLLRGELSIAEVAAYAGFADQSHLTRHCHRLLGVTPKTLRAQGRNVPKQR